MKLRSIAMVLIFTVNISNPNTFIHSVNANTFIGALDEEKMTLSSSQTMISDQIAVNYIEQAMQVIEYSNGNSLGELPTSDAEGNQSSEVSTTVDQESQSVEEPKTEDQVSQAGEESKTEDQGSQAVEEPKTEDQGSQAGEEPKSEDQGSQVGEEPKTEDPGSNLDEVFKTEDQKTNSDKEQIPEDQKSETGNDPQSDDQKLKIDKQYKLPETLTTMKDYDYVNNSITGLSKSMLSLKKLRASVKKYGTLYGKGMPFTEYKKAMNYQWSDCTDYKHKPQKISVNISNTMNYNTYVKTLKKLSRYDGVYLYKIGKSTQGRTLYAIEINIPSNQKKEVIMFTGQIHAREFAGGTYLVKMLVNLVQKAQSDKATMKLLKSHKFVAVPVINVDGREALINQPKKWTKSSGMWKAYINGTDGNRNFPGLLWGQVSKGNKRDSTIKSKASSENYAGTYAGSNNETKALMKWIYHYTIVEKAHCLIDLHEQGSVIYAGKEWTTKSQERSSINLRQKVLKILNKGRLKRRYTKDISDKTNGFEGNSSTITDYALSIASGAKFAPSMGYCAYSDGKKEYMLMAVGDLDQAKFKVHAPNKKFTTLTIEIGKGTKYLGNSITTRKLLAKEYKAYNFDTLMENIPKLI